MHPAAARNLVHGPLWSLQAGRAIASILLVLYHNNCCVFASRKYWSTNPTGKLFQFGTASFYYFFVLSGFTLLYVHGNHLGDPRQICSYARQRLTRVYPVYWVVLSALVAVYFAFPAFGQGFERNVRMMVSSFALMTIGPMRDQQRPETIMLGVWSLYHGILFYVVFGLIILSKRIGVFVTVLWLLASVVMLHYPNDASLASFYLAPIHLLFGFGMVAAALVRGKMVAFPAIVASLGCVLLAVAVVNQLWLGILSSTSGTFLYGVGSAAAVAGFVILESEGRLRVPAALRFLGDASYSIFLAHYPVLILLAKVAKLLAWREAIPLIIWYFALAVAAVLAGVLLHIFVEQPILRYASMPREWCPRQHETENTET